MTIVKQSVSSFFLFFLCLVTCSTWNRSSNNSGTGLAFGFVAKAKLSHNVTSSKSNKILCLFPKTVEAAEEKRKLWNNVAGGLTLGGGLIGFVTKGSKASLIAGSTFGGGLFVSSLLNTAWIGSLFSGMLTYVMGKKFLASQKFVPSGLIASLGIISFLHNIWAIVLKQRQNGDKTTDSEQEE